MARGKVITSSNPTAGTTTVNTTVTATNATGTTTQGITSPPGQVLTGTLQDLQTNEIINFAQSFGAELGIVVGSKVSYSTVTVNGAVIANIVELSHRGEINSINITDDGGMLLDKASKTIIPFAQQGAAESGIIVGAHVNFDRIIDPTTGNVTAVALTVVND